VAEHDLHIAATFLERLRERSRRDPFEEMTLDRRVDFVQRLKTANLPTKVLPFVAALPLLEESAYESAETAR
jgi:hypothetical protein